MKITQQMIRVGDIFDGFSDNGDDGVFAYSGKLAVRPPYQREFVYNHVQEAAVIDTVLRGYPLNVMYWVQTGKDSYEVLDGQQRTLSIMRFLSSCFPVVLKGRKYYADSVPADLYRAILNYELMVYVCEGEESEKLEWFRVVNIAGERLTEQELRNSVYTGSWLFEAKRCFSKRNCAAKRISDRYLTGDPNRQELLEKALKGICELQGIREVTEYMSIHQRDENADELWQYFQDVIRWIESVFPQYDTDMKGLDWCHLYNLYHERSYHPGYMREEVVRLHADEDVQKPKGIYEYLLCCERDPFAARLLQLRAFDQRDKQAAYGRQNGICPICKQWFKYAEMEGDHIKPWSRGGHTTPENCQMLCRECNARKTDRY